jgi:hypothetical protein
MSANDSLERRIADHYIAEVAHRAPDRVLREALATIETTRQRRVLVPAPWRVPPMNGFTRVAVAAVAVIALGAFGLAIFRPGSSTGGGLAPSAGLTAAPTPTASPTALASPIVSPSPDPSAPPPLGSTFTSTVNGISLAYPNGWVAKPATRAWTHADGFNYDSPALDVIHDRSLESSLFIGLASQPLRSTPGNDWVTAILADPEEGCGTPTTPVTVDGASGRMCNGLAAFAAGGHGYFIRLYTSGDQPWIDRNYDLAWFEDVLKTVHLPAGDAGSSAAPARPPSASAKPS